MDFEPIAGKQLVVTSEKSPACQAFGSPDVNDSNYKNLALGTYDIIAMGDSITIGGMTAPWLKIIVDGEAWYCLALTDRCRIEDKPQAPAVDLTEVLAALSRIEAKQDATDTKVQTVLDRMAAAGSALGV